jgi:uncharacterized protein
MANTSFSRMVLLLTCCLLITAVRFDVLPMHGQTRGTTLEVNSNATDGSGRYFALVIGVDKYTGPIPQLRTAVRDAAAIADILKEKYGFQTTLLTDANATRAKILDQIAAYETQLGENDNLLIYYAGHGFRIKEAEKSFWLPVDATSNQSSNRISADDLTTEMATLKARHVLVISDSCYSGAFARGMNSVFQINPDEAFLRKMLSMRSRTLLASGGDEPVADGGPDGHSVFAWALLQALNGETESLFTASALFYDRVQRAVAGNSGQIPLYQPIRNSGDIGGDFVFRRATATEAETRSRLAAAATGYDRGVALFNSRLFSLAAPIFLESCSENDPRSCTYLGYLYAIGQGVPQDYRQAAALYRKACDKGQAAGCSNLGAAYASGQGVPQDYGQAVALFRKACDGGHDGGCNNLGVAYERGQGVPQDYGQAVSHYGKACDLGFAQVCGFLGSFYETGRGVTQDYSRAMALYSRGCDSGSYDSCSALGTLYASGQGIPQDYSQAVALFRKACDGGSAIGCVNLGALYQNGQGVAKDYSQAVPLYRKACDQGSTDGCSNLGVLYQNGAGVTKDSGQAASLFHRACEAGNTVACTNLKDLYKDDSDRGGKDGTSP